MLLADAEGFVFDLDGTLIRRHPDGATPMPGAAEVLAVIRASGRPLVIFTNASHASPAHLAAGVRAGGLDIADDEVLTPVCSGLAHLAREHPGARVLAFATEAVRERLADAGVALVEAADAAHAEVVVVFHVDEVSLEVLEQAAHAVLAGAAFLTGNYERAYAGANGPIISRGAMVTAAIAKAAGAEPTVIGKPSPAAVLAYGERLGASPERVVVTGDDLAMDIALGRLGGSTTILVRSGIAGGGHGAPPGALAADHEVDGVADLLDLLQPRNER